MNRKSGSVVAGGVIVALLGVMLVFVYAGNVRSGATTVSAGSAFVATSDIPVGTRWEDAVGTFKKRDVPSDVKPVTAVTSDAQLNGRSAARAITAGEVITTTQFNTSGTGGLDIPAGQNAVTINLGVPQAVARYIQTGSEINAYVTYKGLPTESNPADATITKLLLSNVKVLANRPMTTQAQETAEGQQTGTEILLTLALTPDQAEQLIFAKENGSVWLGLVHQGDAPVTSGGRTFRSALV